MTGFFVFESRYGDRLGYRCACCHLNVVFAEGEKPRVFHCNRWSEFVAPPDTFWQWLFGHDLPRVKPQAPPFRVLKHPQIENENSNTEV